MADASVPHIQVACVVLRKTAAVFGAVVCDGCAAAHVKEGVGSGNIYAAAGVLCVIAADNDVFVQEEISFALDPKATAGAGRAAAGDRAGAINLKIAVDNDDAALIRFRGQRTVNGVIVQIQLDPRVRRNRQRCRPCGRGHVAAQRNNAALVERGLQRRPIADREIRRRIFGRRKRHNRQQHEERQKDRERLFDAVMLHMESSFEVVWCLTEKSTSASAKWFQQKFFLLTHSYFIILSLSISTLFVNYYTSPSKKDGF